MSVESFFDLGGEFVGEGVQALGEITDVLEKIVVGDEGRNGGEKSSGGGDEGFGDAGSDSAETGGASGAKSGERVNDAPDGAEETDEGSDAGSGGEPGHALFHATDFFGGGELHADGDGRKRFESWRGGISRAGELGLEFAITGGVDVSERRTGGHQTLGIGAAFGGTEDFEELVALAANAAEEPHFLEDERPGNQGEEEQDPENAARDQACLRKNVKDVTDDDNG